MTDGTEVELLMPSLAPGAHVVIAGQVGLQEGARVRVTS